MDSNHNDISAIFEVIPGQEAKTSELVRIEVRVLKHYVTCAKFKHVSGIDIRMAHSMADVAKNKGANPEEWYASFKSIPITDWISIYNWRGVDGWVVEWRPPQHKQTSIL